MALIICLGSFLGFALILAIYFGLELRKANAERDSLAQKAIQADEKASSLAQANEALKARLGGIVDIEAEKAKLQENLVRLRAQGQHVLAGLKAQKERLQQELEDQRLQGEQARAEGQRQQIKSLAEEKRAFEESLKAQKGQAEGEINALKFKISQLQAELKPLDEEANLQSFGFYKPHYDFASSGAYQSKLDEIRAKQKKMIADKTAAVGDIEWSVNGSKTEGKKQINQTLRLLLRAFNGESDAAVAKVRYNNIQVMEERIRKAHSAISALAAVQQCRITPNYLDLKIQELRLAHEYQEKLQAEREEQRRIREQLREEEVAQRELEKARQDAEKEEARYAAALIRARAEAENAVGARQQKLLDDIAALQQKLVEAQINKARAISRAQMTRSGFVYIISNIGSFGENVYKIGMTRRLDPMDRVRELGDASVPFPFDVHAIIPCDDAPALETALHRIFDRHRLNQINARKEFFRANIDEISKAVVKHHGDISIIREPEAKHYRESLAALRDSVQISLNGG